MARATRERPGIGSFQAGSTAAPEQHKPANGSGRHGGEYRCKRAAQGVTEKEGFAAFAAARDFHDALVDGPNVFSEAVVTGGP
jgi:hypothetical protein